MDMDYGLMVGAVVVGIGSLMGYGKLMVHLRKLIKVWTAVLRNEGRASRPQAGSSEESLINSFLLCDVDVVSRNVVLLDTTSTLEPP